MKLIHLETQKDLFADPDFQKSMSQSGIIIPEALQSQYGNKERVFWKDPEFVKAFKELFFNHEMDPKQYEWR